MKRLNNQHILLGVTGGISAYKSADLVRRLRDEGALVRVVMTRSATEFVTPLTFQALSGNPVAIDLLDTEAEAAMGHIELARWADAILIAPAGADFMARLAQGRADDLLSTVCLACDAPLAVAPSMNRVMWLSAATRDNTQTLHLRNIRILGPASGSQACGETGEGRMLEPLELVDKLCEGFHSGVMRGLNVLITAGPTVEVIDPVRYISNRSSGLMGYTIAAAAIEVGASVTLVSGPVALETPRDVKRIDVESAAEMFRATLDIAERSDLFIATAAVADYRPLEVQLHKIKKSAARMSIELVRNEDILATVAALNPGPFCVGFCAETEDTESRAVQKLEQKYLDMIAANRVGHTQDSKQDIGFNSDYNALDVYWRSGHVHLKQGKKTLLARQLVDLIALRYQQSIKNNINTA